MDLEQPGSSHMQIVPVPQEHDDLTVCGCEAGGESEG